jgi:nucleotide-binding universal stress UspA family protein
MRPAFERILLATEHTDFDVGAERVAIDLARHCNLPLLVVLPLVSNPEFEAEAPQLALRAEHQALERLQQLRKSAEAAGVRLVIRVRRGEEPYREIITEAAERNADLVVVRRRGRRGFLAKMLVGEMVGKVATLAPCSVLLVPRAARMWSHCVLAAVDFSPATMTVATVAAAVAASCSLPMLAVSVASGESAEARRSAEAAMGRAVHVGTDAGVPVEGRVLDGRAPEQVVKFGASRQADLIVVGRRGASGQVEHLLLGGTAEKISGLADCAVLVVKT